MSSTNSLVDTSGNSIPEWLVSDEAISAEKLAECCLADCEADRPKQTYLDPERGDRHYGVFSAYSNLFDKLINERWSTAGFGQAMASKQKELCLLKKSQPHNEQYIDLIVATIEISMAHIANAEEASSLLRRQRSNLVCNSPSPSEEVAHARMSLACFAMRRVAEAAETHRFTLKADELVPWIGPAGGYERPLLEKLDRHETIAAVLTYAEECDPEAPPFLGSLGVLWQTYNSAMAQEFLPFRERLLKLLQTADADKRYLSFSTRVRDELFGMSLEDELPLLRDQLRNESASIAMDGLDRVMALASGTKRHDPEALARRPRIATELGALVFQAIDTVRQTAHVMRDRNVEAALYLVELLQPHLAVHHPTIAALASDRDPVIARKARALAKKKSKTTSSKPTAVATRRSVTEKPSKTSKRKATASKPKTKPFKSKAKTKPKPTKGSKRGAKSKKR